MQDIQASVDVRQDDGPSFVQSCEAHFVFKRHLGELCAELLDLPRGLAREVCAMGFKVLIEPQLEDTLRQEYDNAGASTGSQDAASPHASKPPTTSDDTPIVALTIVLTSVASAVNRKMSRTRSNTRQPRAKRFTRYEPSSPSTVFPIAMPMEGKTAPVVETLARNAAPKIASQARYPSSTNAASAMPAGGQTVVTELLMNANRSPSLAAR